MLEYIITGTELGKYLPVSSWLHWYFYQGGKKTRTRYLCFPRDSEYL